MSPPSRPTRFGVAGPRVRRWILAIGVFGLIGWRIGLVRFWVFSAICLASVVYMLSIVDPTLMQERLKPAGKSADAGALITIRLVAAAHVLVTLLDIGGLHFSDTVPGWLHVAGLAVFAAALVFLAHAMAANRFFSTAVRIQDDRGHRVVSQGPYAVVRHPGYAAMIVAIPADALGLGSWWGFALALLYAALIARRVMVEDRFLHENLPGYAEYASRVRYRLVPGVV